MTIKQDRRIGLSPQNRPIKHTKQANQWAYTPKQIEFIEGWLNPSSSTFGNAYQSAVNAGFSKDYARVITADYTNLEWVRAAKRYITNFTPEHIVQALQEIAAKAEKNSDRLRALDMLAKTQGMYIHRINTEVNVTFTNSVPRPKT